MIRARKAPLSLMACCTAAMFALVLAGCGNNSSDNDDDGGEIDSPTTANDLAQVLINKKTCDGGLPQSTNELLITDNQDAVDLTRLTPDCSGS